MSLSLEDKLKHRIREAGPISTAEYMSVCLLDPVQGYYPTRDPLGAEGDFITAPEISQMFGEVLGLWCVQSWIDLGRPEQLHLVEYGPGRGIMMSDMLRAASLEAGFKAAVKIWLIEASAALEAVQGRTLGSADVPVQWVKRLEDVPAGPSLIIGNEFLDCLPIQQLICHDPFAGKDGWVERRVGLDDEDRLCFVRIDVPAPKTLTDTLPKGAEDARTDNLLETCPAAAQVIDGIAQRFAKHPGRALFIDYGPDETEFGDTLQALKRHEKVGVFSDPGNTDLTARVDFAALSEMAKAAGLNVSAAVPQREFLSKLGLEMRAVALIRAKPDAKPVIARQLHRLTDKAEMGELFKAICISSKDLATPMGLR